MSWSLGLLGPSRTFHDLARIKFLSDHRFVPRYYHDFDAVFSALLNEEVDAVLVAVHNTKTGDIGQNREKLGRLKILRVFDMGITLCLGSSFPLALQDVKRVYSHPAVLRQCTELFGSNIEFIACLSTGEAAIRAQEDKNGVVIASKEAIIYHGLVVLAEDMGPKNNTTTFVLACLRDYETVSDILEQSCGETGMS